MMVMCHASLALDIKPKTPIGLGMSKGMKIFIVECVDPMDLIQGRSEASALEKVCTSIGHEAITLTAYSKDDFEKYCGYISSIDSNHDRNENSDTPLCIHIATHGNKRGIAFGRDFIRWNSLFESMLPVFTKMSRYRGKVFLSISACEAGYQELASEIESEWTKNSRVNPPEYIFVTAEEGGVAWDDALVAWTVFYHKLSRSNNITRVRVKKIINQVKDLIGTDIEYFRWSVERDKYLHYCSEGD